MVTLLERSILFSIKGAEQGIFFAGGGGYLKRQPVGIFKLTSKKTSGSATATLTHSLARSLTLACLVMRNHDEDL